MQLEVKIGEMESGRFIGKVKPDKVQSCNHGVTVLVGLVGHGWAWWCCGVVLSCVEHSQVCQVLIREIFFGG